MTDLYISIYKRKDGTYDGEAGISETYEGAMQWLSDYHYAFARAGCTYVETLVIGKAGGQEFIHRQDLLSELEGWERAGERQRERDIKAQELYPQ